MLPGCPLSAKQNLHVKTLFQILQGRWGREGGGWAVGGLVGGGGDKLLTTQKAKKVMKEEADKKLVLKVKITTENKVKVSCL